MIYQRSGREATSVLLSFSFLDPKVPENVSKALLTTFCVSLYPGSSKPLWLIQINQSLPLHPDSRLKFYRQSQECHSAIIISHNTSGYSGKEKSQGRIAGAESQGRHVTLISGENRDNNITLRSMGKGESSRGHKIFQIG